MQEADLLLGGVHVDLHMARWQAQVHEHPGLASLKVDTPIGRALVRCLHVGSPKLLPPCSTDRILGSNIRSVCLAYPAATSVCRPGHQHSQLLYLTQSAAHTDLLLAIPALPAPGLVVLPRPCSDSHESDLVSGTDSLLIAPCKRQCAGCGPEYRLLVPQALKWLVKRQVAGGMLEVACDRWQVAGSRN